MAQLGPEKRQTWDKGGGIRLAENQFPRTVIPDNAHGVVIRNPDMFCWIRGSRFARPGMTIQFSLFRLSQRLENLHQLALDRLVAADHMARGHCGVAAFDAADHAAGFAHHE